MHLLLWFVANATFPHFFRVNATFFNALTTAGATPHPLTGYPIALLAVPHQGPEGS